MQNSKVIAEIDLLLDELRKAIALAEMQPDVTTYSFAEEKYEALMDLVDLVNDEDAEALADVINDILPYEWEFWLDAVEKAELYGELADAEESTCH